MPSRSSRSSSVRFAVIAACLGLVANSAANSRSPFGILTLASDARLNSAAAYPGLSVFDGEELSTGAEGRLAARLGGITLALAGDSTATLHRIESGAHIDLASGGVSVTSPEASRVEVHLEGAMLYSQAGTATNAQISVLRPKSILVVARRGDLEFSYNDEFQVLRQGQTYRIDLDAPGEPTVSGAGAGSGSKRKVAYFILGGAAAGALGWALYHVAADVQPMSPDHP